MKTITIKLKYPIDILFCLSCSILLIPVVIYNINDLLRIILGLPFILFIPGYLLLLCIFPNNSIKTEVEIINKFGISIGLSISVVCLDGILLYFSPFGLTVNSILYSIFTIIFLSGIVAIFRWQKSQKQKIFTFSFKLPDIKSKNKIDNILKIFLVISIAMTIITVIYISASPKKQESFTEFYILGNTGKTTDYPENHTIGENSNVIIGLINHEHQIINYTIEIWLINQTIYYNNLTNTSENVYTEMWFLDKLTIRLNHFTKNINLIWQPQWEYMYSFSINKTGRYTLMFLLFKTPTLDYDKTQNYKDISATKIQSAYDSIYLWLNVKE